MKIICTKEEFKNLILDCGSLNCKDCALSSFCARGAIDGYCEIQETEPLTATAEETAEPDIGEKAAKLFVQGLIGGLAKAFDEFREVKTPKFKTNFDRIKAAERPEEIIEFIANPCATSNSEWCNSHSCDGDSCTLDWLNSEVK